MLMHSCPIIKTIILSLMWIRLSKKKSNVEDAQHLMCLTMILQVFWSRRTHFNRFQATNPRLQQSNPFFHRASG